MRKGARRGVIAAVAASWAVVLLSGCGGGAASHTGPQASQAGPNPGPTAPAGRESKGAGLTGPVSLTVSGGIAGVKDGIEVAPDGDVHVSDRDTPRHRARPLSDDEIAGLAGSLAAIDFDKVPGSVIDRQAADMFQYRLAYAGHTVLTDRSAPLGSVDEVIGQLSGYLDDRKSSGR